MKEENKVDWEKARKRLTEVDTQLLKLSDERQVLTKRVEGYNSLDTAETYETVFANKYSKDKQMETAKKIKK